MISLAMFLTMMSEAYSAAILSFELHCVAAAAAILGEYKSKT